MGSARHLLFAGPWLASWALGACTFPDFVVPRGSGGAGNGAGAETSGGTGPALGGSQQGSGAGGEPIPGGAGGSGAGAGEDGEGGEPSRPPIEIGACGQRPYPMRCRNHRKDGDETDVDCGGTGCAPCAADELCARNSDCGSGSCADGTCARSFRLEVAQRSSNVHSTSLRFQVRLTYLGEEPLLLRDVSIRYYFSRNLVAEPLLATGGGTLLPSGTDLSGSTSWRIARQLRGDGVGNDAYLEVAFTSGHALSPGDSVDLDPQLAAGDGAASFSQFTHHSWDESLELHESKNLSVHVADRRVWGRGPEIDDPLSCLRLGVNLDGPALEVDGEAWLESPASVLTRYQDTAVPLQPSAGRGLEEMLRSGFLFEDNSFTYPVDNGSYALRVYAWSATGGETGTLRVNDVALDRFRAQSFQGGSPWVAMGPYRVTVDDGALKLGAEGVLRVGGFELRTLDE